jgi:hypothetical protein
MLSNTWVFVLECFNFYIYIPCLVVRVLGNRPLYMHCEDMEIVLVYLHRIHKQKQLQFSTYYFLNQSELIQN